MTQMDKAKIEDLLSAYVDDELSPRERTEVKRLVRNDKKLADQLRRLEKQKELMLAMPVVSAPQGLVQDVKGAVERKALLGKAPETKQVRDGHRDLQSRRMMATAAMIVLPVCILGWVVFKIVKPVTLPGNNDIKWAVDDETIDNVVAVSYPLHASLNLSTLQKTAVTEFVYKAIYNNNLVQFTDQPTYADGKTTYPIRGDRQRIVGLLRDLATVWDQLDSTSLTVHGSTLASNALVENVTVDQAIALYGIDVFNDPVKLAKDFNRMNRLIESLPGHGFVDTLPGQSYIAMGPEIPGEPVRTSVGPARTEASDKDAVSNATLFVTIGSP